MFVKQWLFFSLGLTSLILGIIGVILPLLPTTPFILLSAYCFAKSSATFHRWLLSHRVFGPMINDWQRGHIIRKRAKWTATIMIIASLSISFYLLDANLVLITVVLVPVIAVLLFIWRCPEQ